MEETRGRRQESQQAGKPEEETSRSPASLACRLSGFPAFVEAKFMGA
jgi:hypothetical protein